MRRLCFHLLLVTALQLPFACSANVLREDDLSVLMKIDGAIIETTSDVLQTARPMDKNSVVFACLESLLQDLSIMSSGVEHLQSLVFIGAGTIDSSDERLVLDVFKVAADGVLNYLTTARGHTNFVAGICSQSTLVTTKADRALKLLDNSTAAIKSMLRRLQTRP
jgi:hypothetical protein